MGIFPTGCIKLSTKVDVTVNKTYSQLAEKGDEITWELRVYSGFDRKDKPVDKAADAGILTSSCI